MQYAPRYRHYAQGRSAYTYRHRSHEATPRQPSSRTALATKAMRSKTGGMSARIQKARRISASGQATIQAIAVRLSRWRGRVVAALPRRPKAPSQGADTSHATTNGAAVDTRLPRAVVSW